MDRSYSPLQLFQLFFTNSVLETIVKNTNSYGANRSSSGKKFHWVPLTVSEFLAYISLVLYMGLVKVKTYANYWARKTIYNFPYPQSVMSRCRFLAISWNLHLCNLEEDLQNSRKRGTPDYDKLFKIKPLYSDILTSCMTYLQPGRQVSVDERMVASKARVGFKQYMKDKPTKWGFKLFVLADSTCGYTWNFFVYEGKGSLVKGKGLSYDSVMHLLNTPLLGQGYKVYVDNFYSSLTLFMDLLKKKNTGLWNHKSEPARFSQNQRK